MRQGNVRPKSSTYRIRGLNIITLRKVWEMSPSGLETRHILQTPYPVGHVRWRLSSPSAQHLTDLLVVPLTPGVSPDGSRSIPVGGTSPQDRVDLDKDRPGIWDVRR